MTSFSTPKANLPWLIAVLSLGLSISLVSAQFLRDKRAMVEANNQINALNAMVLSLQHELTLSQHNQLQLEAGIRAMQGEIKELRTPSSH